VSDSGATDPLIARALAAGYLDEAISLAAGVTRPWPNPPVGAVVLAADGAVVGRGRHERAGGPHAEVLALGQAGDRAAGGTLLVSLEPCQHHGRTGPCTEAVLASGISGVVYAVSDPTPAGGGAAALTAAGLVVHRCDPSGAGAALLEPWLFHHRTGRPWVTWKVAASLDGSVTRPGADTRNPDARWLTGPVSRQTVHQLRSEVGAIVTGTGTVLADDPDLTARPDPPLPGRLPDPLRVVVGNRAVTGTRLGAAIAAGEACGLPRSTPGEVLDFLHARDVHHVLLECGPGLAGAFAAASLIDEVVWFIAPVVLGGAVPALCWPAGIARPLRLATIVTTRSGDDILLRARVIS